MEGTIQDWWYWVTRRKLQPPTATAGAAVGKKRKFNHQYDISQNIWTPSFNAKATFYRDRRFSFKTFNHSWKYLSSCVCLFSVSEAPLRQSMCPIYPLLHVWGGWFSRSEWNIFDASLNHAIVFPRDHFDDSQNHSRPRSFKKGKRKNKLHVNARQEGKECGERLNLIWGT